MNKLNRFWIIAFLVIMSSISNYIAHAQTMAANPVMWADVPDPDIIRVGNTYYMTSTTMHFNPGVPIMKSTDLVTWETVGYVYDILTSNNNTNMLNGLNMYGKGSWASSLRYANGYYYVYFLSYTTNATHVYRTKDIENGPWTGYTISRGMHDLSVLFDDDGRVYAFYGGTDIHIVELTADGLAIKAGGVDKILISNAGSAAGTSFIVNAEGSHIYKINGTYFLTLISWPNGSGRTELAYRASSLTGTWEGKVLLSNNGVAQGGIVSTPAGKWYGLLFRDNGSVGRIPYLTQVTWTNNWPMMTAPATLDIAASAIGLKGIIASDDFNYSSPVKLSTAWQWNHNPDNINWSMTARPGYFRIATSRVDANIYSARNTLTQRTFGPTSTGVVAMDVTNMKDGDYAGLSAFQDKYGFVGVKMSGTTKSIVMVNASSGTLTEVASAALTQNTVYLRVDCNFANQTDKATFYYSTNGTSWTALGNTLQMSFELTHFVGYRFALFNYSTKTAGGSVDFDYFKTGPSISNLYAASNLPVVSLTAPANNASYVTPVSINLTATASVAGGTITKVEFYNGVTLLGTSTSSPYSYNWTNVLAGTYKITAVATDNLGNKATSIVDTIKVNVAQAAYGGTPWPIPGTIQFENYDLGGNGFAYLDNATGNTGGATFRTDEDVDIENCTDAGNGYNIGFATTGEWMEYTVNVATAGEYNLTIRAACNADGRTVSLTSNGTVVASDIAIPNTAGWQTFTDVKMKVTLTAGQQVLRLTIGASDYVNLNYMSFTKNIAPIQLSTGWNFIGCPIIGSTNIDKALSSIWTNVETLKNQDSFYSINNPAILNSLSTVKWGEGYLVKVKTDCVLDWNVK